MITRLTGAIIRAMLVVLLVATPSLLLPGVSGDGKQIVAFVALFAAALTIFEYGSTYPSLVEFRDAPPFNRIRFLSLFSTVFVLTIIARGQVEATALTQFMHAVGAIIGIAIDFPYSPVRFVVMMLPDSTSFEQIALIRTAAGMAYLISLLTLAIFLIALRLKKWPTEGLSFNVWVNLPTFDPSAGADIVRRLERDARINILLGFALPFLIPLGVMSASTLFGNVTLTHPQTMIWAVSAWAFLPASLFMRGIAMGRIADLIAEKRKLAYAKSESNAAMQAA